MNTQPQPQSSLHIEAAIEQQGLLKDYYHFPPSKSDGWFERSIAVCGIYIHPAILTG